MSVDLFRPYMANDVMAWLKPVFSYDENGRMYLGEGARVLEFERRFSELVGVLPQPLALNSGTSALEIALYLCDVRLGTEVITTPMTCTATNGAIRRLRGTPVWADVDPLTGLIDPADVARKVTRRTKAIMAVDWAGRSCDYAALDVFGLPVIQDAAHNLLIDTTNRGDFVCWSFQAIKHLTTGDGGALSVPAKQHERAKLLRWYGLDRTSSADFRCAQNIAEAGWKAHMNDIAATIGLANVSHAARVVALHRANAAWYDKALAGIPDCVRLPQPDPTSSWWLYTLLVNDRDSFTAHMTSKEIMVSPVHKRNDVHGAYHFPNGPLPGLDYFDAHQVAIPVGWWLTEQDRDRVAAAVWEWVAASTSGSTAQLVATV